MRRSGAEWIRSLFANKEVAKFATWHDGKGSADGEVIRDVYDGEAYQHARRQEPWASEPRHLYVTVVTDGFQPFKGNQSYSCYPFVLMPMNFPPSMR
jgi:hypothetical protein